jgi:Flp pilus assembly protein TadB
MDAVANQYDVHREIDKRQFLASERMREGAPSRQCRGWHALHMSDGRRLMLAWVTGLFVLLLTLFPLRAFAIPAAFAAGGLMWYLTGRRAKRQRRERDSPDV